MKIAVIYDSRTGNTSAMGEAIVEGMNGLGGVEARAFDFREIDETFTAECSAFVFGSPTYLAGPTAEFYTFLEQKARGLGLAGKLGGVFATQQYVHGGADLTMMRIIEHLLVLGMMVYSGGASKGKPVIHIGPVEVSPDKDAYVELFRTYGARFAEQALAVNK